MARKTAKNKKALRRKSEARQRSRVLKQRQDYTKGGRVKAANGFPGFDPNDPSTWPQIDREASRTGQVRRQGTTAPVLQQKAINRAEPQQLGSVGLSERAVPSNTQSAQLAQMKMQELPNAPQQPTTLQQPEPSEAQLEYHRQYEAKFGPIQRQIEQIADSPEYQDLVMRMQNSQGQDQEATRRLEEYNQQFFQMAAPARQDLQKLQNELFGIPSDIRTTPQTPTPGGIGVRQPGVGTGIQIPTISEEDKKLLASQTQSAFDFGDYQGVFPGFDPNDPSTWPTDFGPGDPGDTGTKKDDTTSDYGSRPGETPKEFTEDDYKRISRDGGDANEDGRISGNEWTTWMLTKGPDEGKREPWRSKVNAAINSGVLSPEVISNAQDRLIKDLLDNQDADNPGMTLTDRFYNPNRKLTEKDIRDLNAKGSRLSPMWDENGFTTRAYAESLGFTSSQFATQVLTAYQNTKTGEILSFSTGGNNPPSDDWVSVASTNASGPDPEFRWKNSYADYAGPMPEKDDFGPMYRGHPQANKNAKRYSDAVAQWEANNNLWNKQTPAARKAYWSQNLPKGTNPAPIGTADSEDPARSVLDETYDPESRERYKIAEPPEAFTVEPVSLEGTVTPDTDVQQLDAIDDISPTTFTPTDPTFTRGKFTEADVPEIDPLREWDAIASVSEPTDVARSAVSREADAELGELTERTRATGIDREREELSKGQAQRFEDPPVRVDPVTGKPIEMVDPEDAEKNRRNAILDEEPAEGVEAVIQDAAGYTASERRELKGEAARGDAVSFLEEVSARGDLEAIPPDIAEAIIDDPVGITAQIDTEPVEVQAAIAALPGEALVSAQLENLLAGIDEGVTPVWARPAVQLVNSRMSSRGLDVSTVGRDALFNAIIQTAFPIAQSNAAALQQRANQNLSNEQQANLQQATQEMQLRLTNLANRQETGSQTATLSQQLVTAQAQFGQQARLTEAEQRQQARLQSLQNEQQASMANLGNDQQIEMANLQVEAERLGANQSAINQERLAEFQVAASFLDKNAAFKQQMEVANLTNDQQMRLAFLTAKNQAASENLSAEQQTELANLNKRVELNKTNATLAQQMGLAQLNVDQQQAMQNASVEANMDLTEFNAAQQMEIANSKFMQTMSLQDFSQRQQATMQDATSLASMDLQLADALTKVSIENARNFLQMDMANLSNQQQAYVLDSQQRQQAMLTTTAAQNAAEQFNATSENQRNQFMANLGAQMEQFNASQANAMEQFNAAEANRMEALIAGNEIDVGKFSAQLDAQIDQFNTQVDFQRDQWNSQNAQAIEQSNVSWRRQVNMADTAATNSANQLQTQQLFNLSQQEQAFLWQQLRDEASYYRQQYENEQQRKTTLYATALANESDKAQNVSSLFSTIGSLFNQLATPVASYGGGGGFDPMNPGNFTTSDIDILLQNQEREPTSYA